MSISKDFQTCFSLLHQVCPLHSMGKQGGWLSQCQRETAWPSTLIPPSQNRLWVRLEPAQRGEQSRMGLGPQPVYFTQLPSHQPSQESSDLTGVSLTAGLGRRIMKHGLERSRELLPKL